LEKIHCWKKIKFLFLNKNYNIGTGTHSSAPIKDVQATEEAFSPQKRTSSTSNMKFLNFFLFMWIIFALLDPNSDSGYGSTDLIESGSNPDPKHWLRDYGIGE
jgi:hypothetical protein